MVEASNSGMWSYDEVLAMGMVGCVCVCVEEDQGEGEIWSLEEYQIQFFHSLGKETEAGGG